MKVLLTEAGCAGLALFCLELDARTLAKLLVGVT